MILKALQKELQSIGTDCRKSSTHGMMVYRQFHNVLSHREAVLRMYSGQSHMVPAGIILITVPSILMGSLALWLSTGQFLAFANPQKLLTKWIVQPKLPTTLTWAQFYWCVHVSVHVILPLRSEPADESVCH